MKENFEGTKKNIVKLKEAMINWISNTRTKYNF